MQDSAFRRFLEITLKIHQIFALVDVNYTTILGSGNRGQNLHTHFQEITAQLNQHNGLNYVPRPKSIKGRCFEHAADSKVLIDQLCQIEDGAPFKDNGTNTFYVRILDEPSVSASKDGKALEDEKNAAEIKLAEKYQSRIFDDLKIKQDSIILNLNKPFIQLTMKANGKADLYFHAYFWEKYLQQLGGNSAGGRSTPSKKKKKILKKQEGEEEDPEAGPTEEEPTEVLPSGTKVDLFSGKYTFMKRLIGLSATLSKVIVNIKKFPFHEKMYHKYAKEFGQR